jgi:predicted small lipoprotein YifL
MAKTVNMQKIKPFYLSIKATFVSALAIIFLQACGAKGDLYQTSEPVNSEEVSSQNVEKNKKTNKQDVSEQQTQQLNEKPS